MTLAWNLLFYIEDYMAIKWGNTVCTVIKWGNTTCSQVKWGNTVVYPDSSAICFYSYGANPLSFDYGNVYTGYNGTSQHNTHADISNTTSNGTVTINTNDITFTKVLKIYMTSPRNVSVAISYKCTKFRLVCNLNTVTGAAAPYRIRVTAISGTGSLGDTGQVKVDQSITTASYTGGTYNATVINPNTDRIAFYIETNVRTTGTISEVILYT